MAQTKKTKAGEKDFSASSTPSRKYLIAAYIGGLALAGYAARLAWVYMTYHVLPLQGIILFIIAACFLLNVVTAKCTYTLGEEGLTLQKKSLFQNRTIYVPQEEVIAYVYQGMREKLIASGKVPPELLKKLKEAEAADAEDDMTFEEGIEQLRQEGTYMGGSDYEVTLEDIKEKEGFNEEEYNAAKHDRAETEAAEKKTEAETNTKK